MSESIARRILGRDVAAQPARSFSPTASVCAAANSGRRAACHRLFLGALVFIMLSNPGRSATKVVSTVDGGGQHITSAHYRLDGSIGGIGGISTAVAPAITMRHGYIGQLYEVTGLDIAVTPNPADESSAAQLSAAATLDDATVIVLSGSDVDWSSPNEPYPIAAISAGGTVTTANVYTNATGTIVGYHLGASNSVSLLVMDTNPDDFGIYAGDGIPDSWQVQYFGLDNTSGVAGADPDGDGFTNLAEFQAGTDPTNGASAFRIVEMMPDDGDMLITWTAVGGKRYILQTTTNFSGGVSNAFVDLGAALVLSGTGETEVTALDVGAATNAPIRFYRVRLVP
ncbi:MAG TPA: thrombospondin type 3 repeat-containing protein [Verrucomicrobiae bacterium]|nr:thrombospondin type 3 repeat-containing protein [Verrucomicrobiae bacterium]